MRHAFPLILGLTAVGVVLSPLAGQRALATVVTYPAGERTALATVDREGDVEPCLTSSGELEVSDVADGRILYVDHDALFEISIPCGEPRKLVSLRQLTGPAPDEDDGSIFLEGAERSPDGRRIAVDVDDCRAPDGCTAHTWVGGSDGTGWREIAEVYQLGWVDRQHLLVDDGLDAYAVDVDTGTLGFFRYPQMWSGGIQSQDGRTSPYSLENVGDDGEVEAFEINLVDRRRGSEVEVDLAEELRPGPNALYPFFIENLQSLRGDLVISFSSRDGADGAVEGCRLVLARISSDRLERVATFTPSVGADCDADARFRDGDSAWLSSDEGLRILDLSSGASKDVALPGLACDERCAITVMPERLRGSTPAREVTLVAEPALEPERDGEAGVTRSLPPSWRAIRCRCGPSPYLGATALTDRISDDAITYSMTVDPPTLALSKLRRLYAVGRLSPGDGGCRVDGVETHSERIGGRSFTSLDLYVCAEESGGDGGVMRISVGEVGGRTMILTMNSPNDASSQVVVRSLRFDP